MIHKSVNLLCAGCIQFATNCFRMVIRSSVTVSVNQTHRIKSQYGLLSSLRPLLSVWKEVNISRCMYNTNTMNSMLWYRELSDEDKLQLRRLQFEYEIEKAEGTFKIPKNVPRHYWRTILLADSFEERILIYTDLFEKEGEEQKQLKIQFRDSVAANLFSAEIKNTGILKDTYVYAGDSEVTTRRTHHCLQNSLMGSRFGRPVVFVYNQNDFFLKDVLQCAQYNQFPNLIDYKVQWDLPYMYRVLLSYYKHDSWVPAFKENLPPHTVSYTVEDLAEELKSRQIRTKQMGGQSNFIQLTD